MGVVIIFVDGIGLAPAGETNPLSAGTAFLRGIVPEPGLTEELFSGGTGHWTSRWLGPGAHKAADRLEGTGGAENTAGSEAAVPVHVTRLDACLGVKGLPQSATGQTTLFTGVNAPQRLGRHLSGFPTPTLLRILAQDSLFRRAAEAGRTVTFANPFPQGYLAAVATRRRRHATTTAAVLAAGVPLRTFRDLAAGRAVSHDLTGEAARARGFRAAVSTPELSARRLAALAQEHDLVLFEYFLTDRAGHAQDHEEAVLHLDRLGRFVAALLQELSLQQHTVFIVSDHGNLEDLSVSTHTRNPVPAVAIGARASVAERMESLLDVAPAVLAALNSPNGSRDAGGLVGIGAERIEAGG